MSIERIIAHDLLSIGAVFLSPDQPFTWASGIKSPIYCDNRLTLTAPEVRTHVETGLVDLICKHYPNVEVLMGTSTAGIAHAAIVGHMMGLPMGYVRSGNKDLPVLCGVYRKVGAELSRYVKLFAEIFTVFRRNEDTLFRVKRMDK